MSILVSILRAVALIIILLAIVAIGWNEPLRYRFMSSADIYALENPPKETPPPMSVVTHTVTVPVASPTPNWMWDPNRKTSLDGGAYNGHRTVYDPYMYGRATPYYNTYPNTGS